MYNDLKITISEAVGLSKDALHIHLGLAIFVALILVLRKSPASLVPWLGLLAFELLIFQQIFFGKIHTKLQVTAVDTPVAAYASRPRTEKAFQNRNIIQLERRPSAVTRIAQCSAD